MWFSDKRLPELAAGKEARARRYSTDTPETNAVGPETNVEALA
jgi:hypothetical protein